MGTESMEANPKWRGAHHRAWLPPAPTPGSNVRCIVGLHSWGNFHCLRTIRWPRSQCKSRPTMFKGKVAYEIILAQIERLPIGARDDRITNRGCVESFVIKVL